MDEVETAAADTTSEQSSIVTRDSSQSNTQSHPLSYIHYAHSHQAHLDENFSEPSSKRPRLQDYGHSSDPVPKESIHNNKGKAIPVGIAQPFLKHSQNDATTGQEDDIHLSMLEEKTLSSDVSDENDQALKLFPEPLKLSQILALKETPEASDSEDSLIRFDRFANESVASSFQKQDGLDGGSLYREAEEQRTLDEEIDTHKSVGSNLLEKVIRQREHGQPLVKKLSSTSLPSSQEVQGLPVGKKWIVFVSHSTADKVWARERVVVPLRDPPYKKKVAASYHFMPDPSKYDDSGILKDMEKSCVIIIGLSNSYLNSGRCTNEWKHAVHLSQNAQCKVVVAAVSSCSRPLPLKSYLYLDFIDSSKEEQVWSKLMEFIRSSVEKAVPISPIPSPLADGYNEGREESYEYHQHVEESPETTHEHLPPSHPHQPHTHSPLVFTETVRPHHSHTHANKELHHPPSMSSEFSFGASDQESTHGLSMLNDFEAMYQQCSMDGMVSSQREVGNDSERSDHNISGEGHVMREDAHVIREETQSVEENRNLIGENEHTMNEEIPKMIKVKGENEDVEEGEVNDSSDETGSGQMEDDQATKVTTFYNQLAKPDADKRKESPIFYMRNFNNWVKSVLIRTHLAHLPSGATVLDLCCGKGGDLLKWKEGRINYLVCADISDVSVEAAKGRYHSDKMRNRSTGDPVFDAEFICSDCCLTRLRDVYTNPARRFHLTSCQFSIHYSFESYEKAHMMLRNACENIRPGGYLIGTTIDSNQLIYRLRRAGQNEEGLWSFGNDIFSVTLDPGLHAHENLPLFGAKYNFKLHGVVDLPEYLIHFPTFISMLKEFDMVLVQRQNFYDFFVEHRHNIEDANLLFRMSAFNKRTGTMTPSEWEAIGMYMVFVFQKKCS